jgi:hypothetical protein
MKRVFRNSEIGHAFFHQRKELGSAKTSNGTIYFNEDTIYSYGRHFPIARIVTNDRGEEAVFFTTSNYRQTTAMHKGRVQRAIPSTLPVFHAPNAGRGWGHDDVLAFYRAEVTEAIGKVKRARQNSEYRFEALTRVIGEANKYAEFFGIELPFRTSGILDEYSADIEKWKAEESEKERARQAVKEREASETISQWLAGENVRIPYSIKRAYLRIKGETIETSLGAEFPLSHACRGLQLVERMVTAGRSYARSESSVTIRLGHYSIDSIDASGTVRAGCHTVLYEDIARISPAIHDYCERVRDRSSVDLSTLSEALEMIGDRG